MKRRNLFLLYSPLIKGVRGLFLSTAYCLLVTAFLLGCGGGGGGDTVGVYDTVTLTATATGIWGMYSDIATAADSDTDTVMGCFDSPPDVTYNDDFITFKVKSTAIPNLPSFVKISDVRLTNVTVSFASNPVGAYPPLAPFSFPLNGQIVSAGGTLDLDIPVVTTELKKGATLSAILCPENVAEYKYLATLTFEGVEILTNKEEKFSTSIQVWISNYSE